MIKEEIRIHIDDVDFSVRTYNLISNLGIKYLNEFSQVSVKQLLNLRNCGRKSINEIRKKLAENNIVLLDDILLNDLSRKELLMDIPEVLKEIKKRIEVCQDDLRFLIDKIRRTLEEPEKVMLKSLNQHWKSFDD